MIKLNIMYSRKGIFRFCFGLSAIVCKAVLATLMEEGFSYYADLSVTFCNNKYIRELNREHRGKDAPTDVLSFPMFEKDELVPLPGERSVILGDIVISLERAKEQAKEVGNSLKREVAFLAIHSTLHLLGYDHERSAEEDELQCEKQRKIISTLNIK